MLLFTLLQTACSKETNSEDNCNAVGSCWSTVSKQQWQKTAYALAFNMFSQSVSRFLVLGHRYQDFLFWVTGINISCFGSQVSTFLVLGHTQLICNWLQCTASWKVWCHSQVSTAGALARDKLQQRVGKTCRQTQKQGQGQTKRMQAAHLDMLGF